MLRNQKESPEISSVSIEPLIETAKLYLNQNELNLICNAFEFARKAHEGVFRKSGHEYLSHPLSVAQLLLELKLDANTITAALLHDVVEDTSHTIKELENRFGHQVAKLVDGVSRVESATTNIKAASYSKLFIAMLEDIRVVMIKLADRLHNMRTIKWKEAESRNRIANETLEVYAPLAHRLGMTDWGLELQDISLQVIHPLRYRVLREELNKILLRDDSAILDCSSRISKELKKHNLDNKISNRTKGLYSIYQKMLGKGLRLHEVYDLFAVRIVVKDTLSCYKALGIIHQLYSPIAENFKDYIALPKSNGYQSLHTVVQTNNKIRLEIQIRTQEMNEYAEKGIASHMIYKTLNNSKIRDVESAYTKHYREWFNELLKIHETIKTDNDFFSEMKHDMYYDDCYVFARNGKIIKLPQGSTALDFAYAISPKLGTMAMSAMINQRYMPLSTVLTSGKLVIINTSDKAITFASYLDFVITPQAKQGIKARLIEQNRNIDNKKTIFELSQCCSPIRGDKIVGVKKVVKGNSFTSIHRDNCQNINTTLKDNQLEYVDWQDIGDMKFACRLKVILENKKGVLAKANSVILQTGIDIIKLQIDGADINDGAITTADFIVSIQTRTELAKLIRRLDKITHIKRIQRI